MPSVFDFTDYRQFLKAWYRENKARTPNFSYRYIASKAGFKSAGHISRIMSGSANLSSRFITSLIALIRLTRHEGQFFEALVHFNQAKTHQQKKRYFDILNGFSRFRFRSLDGDASKFYAQWYYAVIRDILSFHRFSGDYQELARMVDPPITPREARKAIEVLRELSCIIRGDDGYYYVADPAICISPALSAVALSEYALAMLERAQDAINHRPADQRSASWVGFAVSDETFASIREEIRLFRKKILTMAQNDPNPTRAWHLNMQLFPVSRCHQRHGGEGGR